MPTQKPLTVNEALDHVEELYGEKYHYNTFYAWLTQGKLKGFKRGGQWRIEVSALKDFFCHDSRNPTNRLEGKAA